MKFYTHGDKSNPVILLLPGTCCHYTLFDHVIPYLTDSFYVVVASYDGFDETENSQYLSMNDETEKIEKYIKDTFNGHIACAYGCSLGGSFVAYLIQRNNIQIDHGIIGSSDMDEASPIPAFIKGHIMTPFLYSMIHSGKIPNFMTKKLEKLKGSDPERYEQMQAFLKTFMVPALQNAVTKKSIYNQYYSDLVTKLDHQIHQPNSTIHVFYALKMGEQYRQRYLTFFKDPDIREQNMNHETFFFCYPEPWSKEVKSCVFNQED